MDKIIRKRLNGVMKAICEYVAKDSFTLDHIQNNDGRLVSAKGEEEILKIIKKYADEHSEIEFIESDIRSWRDFQLKVDNKYDLPVNIKLTTVNSKGNSGNDNVSSKEGLIWTFTEEDPMNNRSWPRLKEAMKSPKIESNRDYYFLIVDKNNLEDIWFTSFKQMNKIKINANNLPFQAVWTDNRDLIEQSDLDAFVKLFTGFYGGLSRLSERIESLAPILDILNEDDAES